LNNLERNIQDIINKNGPISFKEFMQIALYAPEMGYYNRHITTIGKKGDFYTSSSLHKSFSAIFALQAQEIWEILDFPERFVFLEYGAGMGYFAKDFLDYLQGTCLFEALQYFIIEINPYMKKNQQEVLKEYAHKVRWVKDISEMESFKGLVFSNEVLDAFAVNLIEIKEGIICEVWIDCHDGIFQEILKPCGEEIISYIRVFCPNLLSPDLIIQSYRTEINLKIKDWLTAISSKITEGFIITVDYGYSAQDYYDTERNKGTLLCYYQHQVDDNPYENIGEKDITAHINFSSLVRWGNQLGIKSCGFTTQGSYIIAMGIDKVIVDLYGNNPDAFELTKIKGLFLPEGFGNTHKVLVQYKGMRNFSLKGFSLNNSLKRL